MRVLVIQITDIAVYFLNLSYCSSILSYEKECFIDAVERKYSFLLTFGQTSSIKNGHLTLDTGLFGYFFQFPKVNFSKCTITRSTLFSGLGKYTVGILFRGDDPFLPIC